MKSNVVKLLEVNLMMWLLPAKIWMKSMDTSKFPGSSCVRSFCVSLQMWLLSLKIWRMSKHTFKIFKRILKFPQLHFWWYMRLNCDIWGCTSELSELLNLLIVIHYSYFCKSKWDMSFGLSHTSWIVKIWRILSMSYRSTSGVIKLCALLLLIA